MTLGNMRDAGPAHLPDDLLATNPQRVIITPLEIDIPTPRMGATTAGAAAFLLTHPRAICGRLRAI
jgi:hypothetical protein